MAKKISYTARIEGETVRLERHYSFNRIDPRESYFCVVEPVELKTITYSGHIFSDFYAQRSPSDGPGWFIYGRNAEKYGRKPDGEGAYVMLCARPDVKAQRSRGYNGQVRRGFRNRAEAQAVADCLNRSAVQAAA